MIKTAQSIDTQSAFSIAYLALQQVPRTDRVQMLSNVEMFIIRRSQLEISSQRKLAQALLLP